MTSETIWIYLENNWSWAVGLAAAMMAITAVAGLINDDKKDTLALWLMGAQSDNNWSKSFNSLFDAIFGERHFSLNCFLRSSAFSLVAVILLWFIVGGVEHFGFRISTGLPLGTALVYGLMINIVADYVSLLETRFLLSKMPRRSILQFTVLIVDGLLSAAIIWLAIFLFLNGPLYGARVETFAEVIGVFSIFSVFFYSTFLTSVWAWIYVLSTSVMRLFSRLKISEFLDVEKRPVLVLSNFIGAVSFLGALAIAGLFTRDHQNLTVVDRALCSQFKGHVCLDVASLTREERIPLELIVSACEGGAATFDCVSRGIETWDIPDSEAPTLWKAACAGGSPAACTNYGTLLSNGIGVAEDLLLASRYFSIGCERGHAAGCTRLGLLYRSRNFENADDYEAGHRFLQGCYGGSSAGCQQLAYLEFETGIQFEIDPSFLGRTYSSGCSELPYGCSDPAGLFEQVFGIYSNPRDVSELFSAICQYGGASACTENGHLHEVYFRSDVQSVSSYYERGCNLGDGFGCFALAGLMEKNNENGQDTSRIRELYEKACRLGAGIDCQFDPDGI